MKTLLQFFIFTLFFAFSGLEAQTSSEFCTKADAFSMLIKHSDAKNTIDAALKNFSNDYDVLWHAAKIYVEYGETIPENQQEVIYVQAKEFAEKALQINPNGMQAYIRRASASGKIALFKGVFSVGGLVKSVRDDTQKAISLNNAGQIPLATSHYILGRVHLKLCDKPKLVRIPLGLGFGNMEEAIEHLKKAVELRNGFIMFHLDYARALVEEDKYQEAKDQLYKIPSMQLQSFDDDKRKKEAQELLEKIKNK